MNPLQRLRDLRDALDLAGIPTWHKNIAERAARPLPAPILVIPWENDIYARCEKRGYTVGTDDGTHVETDDIATVVAAVKRLMEEGAWPG